MTNYIQWETMQTHQVDCWVIFEGFEPVCLSQGSDEVSLGSTCFAISLAIHSPKKAEAYEFVKVATDDTNHII